MPSSAPHDLLDTALEAARAGAAVLSRYFRDEALVVESKAANDFVSRADRESEEAAVAVVRRRHPDHGILAEEGGGRQTTGGSEVEWLIDPLDGTTNFLQGLPVFCISVACRAGDELLAGVVLDPTRDDVFAAARGAGAHWNGRPIEVSHRPGLEGSFLATGYPFKAKAALGEYLAIFRDAFERAKSIRRCGAAALDLAYTAAGVYDGFFEFRLSPWDLGAGVLLIEQAGGVVTDLDGGRRFMRGGNTVAGGSAVHAELLEVVRRYAGEALLDRKVPRDEPAVAAT